MRQVKVFVDGVDCTGEAFPQGNAFEAELSFLLWWGNKTGYVPGFRWHKAPSRVCVDCPHVGGQLIGVKEKGGMVFEIYLIH
jgi:hypothetical protein